MAKISLISWRLRRKKLPETEAQRRARAREESDQCWARAETLDGLIAAPPFELLEFDEEHLMAEMDTLALVNSNTLHEAVEERFDVPAKSCVSLNLTVDQSRALMDLPLFSASPEENIPYPLFKLSKSQDHRGMTLQFSLYTAAIPDMISLKEVCCQLKFGRRTIMRLIRRGELRCYRIAHRYRFAVEDVKHYLDRIATY